MVISIIWLYNNNNMEKQFIKLKILENSYMIVRRDDIIRAYSNINDTSTLFIKIGEVVEEIVVDMNINDIYQKLKL